MSVKRAWRNQAQVFFDYAAGQLVSFDAVTSAQSGAINATVARVVATQDCWYRISAEPTADKTGTSAFLPAGAVEYVALVSGHRFAVIGDAASGSFSIIPAEEI